MAYWLSLYVGTRANISEIRTGQARRNLGLGVLRRGKFHLRRRSCDRRLQCLLVDVIAGHVPGAPKGFATMMLTVVISISALLVVLVAPIIGTICDATATKKTWLFYSTFVCIVGTATLAAVAPGQWVQGMIVMTVSNTSFFVGENLIAAFLPEIAHQNDMGRISALGWAAGYVGSLLSLGMCFAFMLWAKKMGQLPTQYVPTTMLFCSAYFAMAVAPTFLWLKERALPDPHAKGHNFIAVGFERLKRTITHARHYRDPFRFSCHAVRI